MLQYSRRWCYGNVHERMIAGLLTAVDLAQPGRTMQQLHHLDQDGCSQPCTYAGHPSSTPRDAFEMMASSPPGGFAPGAGSPFLPSFSQAAPPLQPFTSSSYTRSHIPGDFRSSGPFSQSARSQQPITGHSPSSQSQQDPSSPFLPSQPQSGLHSPPMSQQSRGASLLPMREAGQHYASDSIFGSSLMSPSSHAASPSTAPRSPYGYQDEAGSQMPASAHGSPSNAVGLQGACSSVQPKPQPTSPWQPQVAAAGPSWLQPATWQATGRMK